MMHWNLLKLGTKMNKLKGCVTMSKLKEINIDLNKIINIKLRMW